MAIIWTQSGPEEVVMQTPSCPVCGSEETNLVKKYTRGYKLIKEYECMDCDHSWMINVLDDDDDIPF